MNGPGLIPLSSIREYAREYGLVGLEYELFKRTIIAVDNRQARLIGEKSRAASAK